MEDRDQNVYVISLDALDMNLLPAIYNLEDDKIAPLWASNLDRQNNECYQFEIKCKESEESVKDESPKPEFESVICDICDINVPRPFLGKHRKSSRHITNVKIADIALHRMKKYINNTDNENHYTNYDEIHASVYFCTTCVTVVDSKEKATHEESLAHKNSVIIEKIFSDFLLLYHSQEKINDDYTKTEAYTKKVDLDAKLSDAVLKFVNGTSNADDFSNNGSKSIEKQINASKKAKHDVVPKNETAAQIESPRLSLKDYLTLINSRIDHPMFFKLTNDNNHIIEIETIDGSVVRVREDNFHAFNRVGKKLMQCYTCKEIFKEKFTDEHKMSEKHIQCMIIPLADKHCARKIDNCLSHCLICNVVTEYSDLHSLCDEDHEENLREALISDKVEDNQYSHKVLDKNSTTILKDNFTKIKEKDIYQKDNKWIEVMKKVGKVDTENGVKTNEKKVPSVIPNKYFCTSCNEFISTYRRSKHDATKKHVLNSKSKYHYLMREVENQLFCNICDVEIKNDIECVKAHVFEKEHLKKYNQILVDNRIKQNRDIFYCEVCDEVLLIKKELMHVNAKSHQEKCFSVEYLVAVTEKIEKEDDKMPIIEFFHCNVCNVKVPNYEHNIQEHMNGKSHALNFAKTNTATVDDDHDNDKQKVVTDMHYLMEPTKFAKLLNCKVCNVITLHNETCVSEHLASTKHLMNFNKLLKDNDVVLKTDNCYCNICKAFVGIKNEFMHIYGKKHKSNREKLKLSNVSLSKSNSDLSVDSIEKPSVSNVKHVNNINKPSVSNVKDLSNISNPSVSNVKDVSNLNTPSVSNVKNVSNLNKPSISNVKDISNISNPSVSNVKDLSNISNPSVSNVKDLSNINKPLDIEPEMLAMLQSTPNPKEVICKICNVKVPFTEVNVSTHINGNKHKVACKDFLEKIAKLDPNLTKLNQT